MKTVSRQNLLAGLFELGIGEGDNLILHSSASTFGMIEGGPETFLKILINCLGPEGTLIMPTFNFEILKENPIVFDVVNTPSKMGIVSENFRVNPQTKRGHHLFHPWAYNGKLADYFKSCLNITDWGPDSPLELFYQKNVKILLQGVDFTTCTILHYCEYKLKVPYRYEYEFPDAYLIDEKGLKRKVKNIRYKHTGEAEQDFNKLLEILEEKQLIKDTVIGNSICRLIEARPLINTTLSYMEKDPYYFTKNGKLLDRMPVMKGQINFSPKNLIGELWQKNRALVSDGFIESLERIQEIFPFRIRKYPSGSEVWTWTIPKKWYINEAYIESNGERLLDIKDSLLHVVIGTIGIDKEVSHDELMKHVFTDENRPNAIPYVWQYYKEDWGFCIRKNDLKKFKYKKYRVHIDAGLEDGDLAIGEYDVSGYKDEIIVFPIHLDHPAQCNDNLSGITASLYLIDKLQRLYNKYTYKFLFLPETIGSIAYLANNQKLKERMKYGIVMDTVGHRNSLFFQQTLNGNERINDIFRHVMKHELEEFREYEWLGLERYGNDERMFDVPGINIPSISISRHPYPEYHSDKDTPDIIHEEMVIEAAEIVFEVIQIIEKDFIPKQKYEGIPYLGKYGLYVDYSEDPSVCIARNKALYYLGGDYSVFEIAKKVGTKFEIIFDFCKQLQKNGLIENLEVNI